MFGIWVRIVIAEGERVRQAWWWWVARETAGRKWASIRWGLCEPCDADGGLLLELCKMGREQYADHKAARQKASIKLVERAQDLWGSVCVLRLHGVNH